MTCVDSLPTRLITNRVNNGRKQRSQLPSEQRFENSFFIPNFHDFLSTKTNEYRNVINLNREYVDITNVNINICLAIYLNRHITGNKCCNSLLKK